MIRIAEHMGLGQFEFKHSSGDKVSLSPDEETEAIKNGIRERIKNQVNQGIKLRSGFVSSFGSAVGLVVGGLALGLISAWLFPKAKKFILK